MKYTCTIWLSRRHVGCLCDTMDDAIAEALAGLPPGTLPCMLPVNLWSGDEHAHRYSPDPAEVRGMLRAWSLMEWRFDPDPPNSPEPPHAR
jgi:hypothetical protein